MWNIQSLFKRLFPNEKLTHHLSDLNNHLSETGNKNNGICLSMEKNNKSRLYCCLAMDQLVELFLCCPLPERTLYESIPPNKPVKAYIDFEYYRDNNIDIKDHYTGPMCSLKILYYLLNNHETNTNITESENLSKNVLNQFLVLEAYVYAYR